MIDPPKKAAFFLLGFLLVWSLFVRLDEVGFHQVDFPVW